MVGAGVIGRSLALAYAQNFPSADIFLHDCNPEIFTKLQAAVAQRGVCNLHILSDEAAFLQAADHADVFDQCVPIDKMGAVQELVRGHLPEGCIITNRGSAQVYALQQILPHVEKGRVHFGAHMLVGREAKPGEALRCYPEMFVGQTCVIEALPKNARAFECEAHAKLTQLNQSLGMEVKALPLHIHDQLLGAFSHENTAALRVLVNATGPVSTGLSATIMRASVGLEAMWLPVYKFNQQAVVQACDVQSEVLGQFKQALFSSDRGALTRLMRQAHEFRMRWPDAEEPIEGLLGTLGELNGQGQDEQVVARKVLMPLLFGVSRTLGFQAVVERLRPDLERYGHHFTDLLNTSAKDSTLAAKYNPEMLADLMWAHRAALLSEVLDYERSYQSFAGHVQHISCDEASAQALSDSIRKAADIMNGGPGILPRRPAGGQGFDWLVCPTMPGAQEFPLLPSPVLNH